MNKIQIRAEILTLITKLQTTTAVSDEMFATLDAEPDKQAIMDVLLKELARAKEQKAFVICYILTRLFDKDTLVENLREFIRDRKISDYAKMIAFNLLRDLGSEVHYDEVNGYFTEFDQIVEEETKEVCYPDKKTNTVVVLSSNKMGEGSEELGQILMKGFIYALTELDDLPSTILLYNSGVKLSTEGSNSINDLKTLQAQGVEILSCGTCLNYYELTEKLEVGEVTNMYFILEKMSQADKIIRP